MSLRFTIFKNEYKMNESNIGINLENFEIYRKTMNNFQKDVNCYLTALIEECCSG